MGLLEASGCGVYQILNTDTGKSYVGGSANIKKRWGQHRSALNKRKHVNPRLQCAYNKHGKESFECLVIEYCSPEDVLSREQFWMDALGAARVGYNVHKTAGSPLGTKHSAEAISKISRARSGSGNHFYGKPAWNRGMPGFFKGRKHSDEAKAKLREARTKKPAMVDGVACFECSCCGGVFAKSLFVKDKHKANGITSACRQCRYSKAAERLKNGPA